EDLPGEEETTSTTSSEFLAPGEEGDTTTTTEPQPDRDEGLSIGAIVAILISGLLFVAAGLAAATWWYVRHTRPMLGDRPA
ncbi:MAG: hypothetical protein WD232_05030, partial [Acidimicrobiales bacterium]